MFCINLSTKCNNHLGRLPEGKSAKKLVERGDGSYDSTSLFLYISRLLYLGTIHCTQQGLGALLYGSYRSEAKNPSPQVEYHNNGSLMDSFRRDIFKLARITLLAVVYEVVVCET
jgi:hypothetical protein